MIGFWPKLGSLATINRLPKCNASPPVIVCGMPPFSGNVKGGRENARNGSVDSLREGGGREREREVKGGRMVRLCG